MRALTAKQQAFIGAYLETGNATEAARRAGYAPKWIDRQAVQNMRCPAIRAAIQKAMDARAARTQVTIDRVVTELAKVGFASLAKFTRLDGRDAYLDFSDATEDDLAVIQEITQEEFTEGRGDDQRELKRTKIKLHSKLNALEQLMKHLLLDAGKPTDRTVVEVQDARQRLLDALDVALDRNARRDQPVRH